MFGGQLDEAKAVAVSGGAVVSGEIAFWLDDAGTLGSFPSKVNPAVNSIAFGNVSSALGLNATVGGGVSNAAGGDYSTIAGGYQTLANSEYSKIGLPASDRLHHRSSLLEGRRQNQLHSLLRIESVLSCSMLAAWMLTTCCKARSSQPKS
jgi:hypothetical protein